MKHRNYKAVFRTEIEFLNDGKHDSTREPLRPGRNYWFDESRGHSVSYTEIVNKAVSVIEKTFGKELQKYTYIPIKDIYVQAVYEGSIEIIFTVALNIAGLIGGIKDLYDLVVLIRDISKRHIKSELNDYYGKFFDVHTYELVPRHMYEHEIYKVKTTMDRETNNTFFWYLLISNIVLLICIGLLTVKAVIRMYG